MTAGHHGTPTPLPGGDYFTCVHLHRAEVRVINQLKLWAVASPSTSPAERDQPLTREGNLREEGPAVSRWPELLQV